MTGGETRAQISAWTVDTYAAHNEALRAAQEKFENERDRRYTEVNAEKEKAVKIKEMADRDALELARDIQKYKDEKANELREQINRERGLYASKDDVIAAVEKLEATMSPLLRFVATEQGGEKRSNWFGALIVGVIVILSSMFGIAGVLYAMLNH
jgi:CHASE3 domain sensor protein